jgi:hypothetical protein
VPAQPSGYRLEMPGLSYNNNMKGWGPELCARRPDITMAMVDTFLTNMYGGARRPRLAQGSAEVGWRAEVRGTAESILRVSSGNVTLNQEPHRKDNGPTRDCEGNCGGGAFSPEIGVVVIGSAPSFRSSTKPAIVR